MKYTYKIDMKEKSCYEFVSLITKRDGSMNGIRYTPDHHTIDNAVKLLNSVDLEYSLSVPDDNGDIEINIDGVNVCYYHESPFDEGELDMTSRVAAYIGSMVLGTDVSLEEGSYCFLPKTGANVLFTAVIEGFNNGG